jgi:toxin ParE1/3/4
MSSPNNYTLIFSPDAIEDLKDIVAYSVATWGTEQARKYNQKLKSGLTSIRQNPRLGRPHPQLPPQYKVYHVGRHFIVYTVKATNIEIVRVLHDRMDLPSHIN